MNEVVAAIRRLEEAGELPAHEDGGFDPVPAWTAMMRNEKPGGHGERSVAVGVLGMVPRWWKHRSAARQAVHPAAGAAPADTAPVPHHGL